METFLDILFLCLLSGSLSMNLSMLKKINQMEKSHELFRAEINDSLCVNDETHRSLLALRESLEATKPMKSNNWDSIREAFKGPVRIEVNERN